MAAQVSSGSGTPSASRLVRMRASGSPGTSTSPPGAEGWALFTKSTYLAMSAGKKPTGSNTEGST